MEELKEYDNKENTIYLLDNELLDILLKDNSSNKNIIWATNTYANRGKGYGFKDSIKKEKIIDKNSNVIKPRTQKSVQEQAKRVKDKAEVFTPSWVCNQMANHLDSIWFERENIFNVEDNEAWITNKNKIKFTEQKSWQDYITLKILEITCGEAPFLVSRYNTVTGEWIEIENRIGLLDRKLRVICENVEEENEWLKCAETAYKSVFGYEWQGDSLLIARKNLLYTFIEYYRYKFDKEPEKDYIKKIAKIIAWNIWQMDGLKYVIPDSCREESDQLSLFAEESECTSCVKNNNRHHKGVYCKVKNWKTNRTIKFYYGEKKMKFDFVIGNPPYQEINTNNKMSKSIYPDFVQSAKKVATIVSLIMPARWTSGENGPYKETKGFIDKMIDGNHLKSFTLYASSTDLFHNVDIKGGVCYFVYDEKYVKDAVNYTICENGVKQNAIVSFREVENIIIRFPELITILKKSRKALSGSMKTLVSSRNPFGFISDFFEKNNEGVCRTSVEKECADDYGIYGLLNAKRVIRYIPNNILKKNIEGAKAYKIFIPRANGSGVFGEVFSSPMLGSPMFVCTDTFLQVGQFDNELEARNLLKYIKTKYFRAMVGIKKTAVFNYKDCFEFVPLQDFTENSDIDWSKSIQEIDRQLYKKYNLNATEIEFIEKHVKEMV